MTMNQGDGVKKEDRKVGRDGARFSGKTLERTLRQDVRHENRGLQRITDEEARLAQILNASKGIGKKA